MKKGGKNNKKKKKKKGIKSNFDYTKITNILRHPFLKIESIIFSMDGGSND